MKTMTKEQLAEQLDGRSRRDEITDEQIQLAKENNLLVLFGASDDLLVARGAIYDEYVAYKGGEFLLVKDGEMYADNEEENTYHKAIGDGLYEASEDTDTADDPHLIKSEWCPDGNDGVSWRISTNMPSASFTLMGDDEEGVYCEGVVIDLDEVQAI